jgi:hypothetical protein
MVSSDTSAYPQALYLVRLSILSDSGESLSIQLKDSATIARNDIGDHSCVPRLCGGVGISNCHLLLLSLVLVCDGQFYRQHTQAISCSLCTKHEWRLVF